jgi:hypothetical protein
MTACCLLGGDCGCGVSWEHAHLATICPCRCHVSLLAQWCLSGNALSGGEWTGVPGCHPGRWAQDDQGWKGLQRAYHCIGFPHFGMNGHRP